MLLASTLFFLGIPAHSLADHQRPQKEKWDTDSTLSPDEQMRQIFARFLDLPLAERQVCTGWLLPPSTEMMGWTLCGSDADEAPQPQVYTQQVMDRRVYSAGTLPQTEQDILAHARPYSERNLGASLLLRTYYGPGSDVASTAIVQICRAYAGIGPECILDDAARYGYGEDWQRIFSRIPQLLEVEDGYDEERAAEFAKAQEDSDPEDEELGGWSKDDLSLGELFNRYHLASRVGVIYVLDEEALGEHDDGSSVSDDDRELLVVWYDAHGKTVRWRRRSAVDLAQEMALICTASIDDHPVWTEAEIGEDYDWDGPLGPPSTEEDGESEGESDADP